MYSCGNQLSDEIGTAKAQEDENVVMEPEEELACRKRNVSTIYFMRKQTVFLITERIKKKGIEVSRALVGNQWKTCHSPALERDIPTHRPLNFGNTGFYCEELSLKKTQVGTNLTGGRGHSRNCFRKPLVCPKVRNYK